MSDATTMFHMDVWKAFGEKVYEKTFTAEDMLDHGKENYINTVLLLTPEGRKEDHPLEAKFVKFSKHGKKYIVPINGYDDNKLIYDMLPVNIDGECQELQLKKSDMEVYRLVKLNQITTLNVNGEKLMSFNEFIDGFNPVKHTQPRTATFLKLHAIGSKSKGVKDWICAQPAAGKNAYDTLINEVTRDTMRVTTPTIAKLETGAYFNQKLMPDEMTSLAAGEVRIVEPFFLQIADATPRFTKHSQSPIRDMNNVDITMLSVTFTFNRPQDLKHGETFFENIWKNKAAIKSRYPALLIEGEITEMLPKLNNLEARNIMEKNFEKIRKFAKTLVYYKDNLSKELHNWDRAYLCMKGRHVSNFQGVIDAIDVYCKTQDEFNDWMIWINTCIENYNKMVSGIESEPETKTAFESYETVKMK